MDNPETKIEEERCIHCNRLPGQHGSWKHGYDHKPIMISEIITEAKQARKSGRSVVKPKPVTPEDPEPIMQLAVAQPTRTDLPVTANCEICGRTDAHQHDGLLTEPKRWIGVDFDCTLATHPEPRIDPYALGQPIPAMVERVRGWISSGYEVRILTARMCEFSHTTKCNRDLTKMEAIIRAWCKEHIGTELPVVNHKDGAMEVLWDDRAVSVQKDTGLPYWSPV